MGAGAVDFSDVSQASHVVPQVRAGDSQTGELARGGHTGPDPDSPGRGQSFRVAGLSCPSSPSSPLQSMEIKPNHKKPKTRKPHATAVVGM